MRVLKKSLLCIIAIMLMASVFTLNTQEVNAKVIQEYSNTQADKVLDIMEGGDYSFDELIDTLQTGDTLLDSLYYMTEIEREDLLISLSSKEVYQLELYTRFDFLEKMATLKNNSIVSQSDIDELNELLDVHLQIVQFYAYWDLDDADIEEAESAMAEKLGELNNDKFSSLNNYVTFIDSKTTLDIADFNNKLSSLQMQFGDNFYTLVSAIRNLISGAYSSDLVNGTDNSDTEEVVAPTDNTGTGAATESVRPYERDLSKSVSKFTSLMKSDKSFDEIMTEIISTKYYMEVLYQVDTDTKQSFYNKITPTELYELRAHVKYAIEKEAVYYDNLSKSEVLRELDVHAIGSYFDLYMDTVYNYHKELTASQINEADNNVLRRELALLKDETAKDINTIAGFEVYLASKTDLNATEFLNKIESYNKYRYTGNLLDIQLFKDYTYEIFDKEELKEKAYEKLNTLASSVSTLAEYKVTGYTAQKHSWGLRSGYFTVNNILAFCCQYYNKSATVGTVMSSVYESGNSVLRKVVYYGYNGPANRWGTTTDARIETAIACSDAHSGLSATGVKDKYEQLYFSIVNNPGSYPEPPSNFHVWVGITPSTSMQDLVWYTLDPVYTVTYKGNGGRWNGTDTWSENVTYNTSYVTEPNFFTAPTGYSFKGWNESANGTGTDWTSWINRGWTYTRHYNTTLYAQWRAHTYKIVYNGNGNTGGSTGNTNCTYNSNASIASNGFSKTGHTFSHWTTNANGTGTRYNAGQSIRNLTATDGGTINLYAQWTVNTYSITYNYNGGSMPSGVTNPTQYTYGVGVNSFNDPVRGEYLFLGWYTDSACTNKITSISSTSTGNKTLYAGWMHPNDISGTYIDGINGKDTNNGRTPSTPVKTLKQAYTVAKSTGGTIYVVGRVPIYKSITLDKTYYKEGSTTINIASGQEVKIMRYSKPKTVNTGFNVSTYTGELFHILTYGDLTLQDIIIDGHGQAVTNGHTNNIANAVTSCVGPLFKLESLINYPSDYQGGLIVSPGTPDDDDGGIDFGDWGDFGDTTETEYTNPDEITSVGDNYSDMAQLNIKNATLQNNYGEAIINGNMKYAGRVYMSGGTIKYIDSMFNENTYSGGMGAIVNYYYFKMTGGTIENNHAQYQGGVFYNTMAFASSDYYVNDWADTMPAELIISGGTFRENTAHTGGVILNEGDTTISGGEFIANGCDCASASDQGGVIASMGKLKITGGKFANNSSTNGGVIHLPSYYTEKTTITNAEFKNNLAWEYGGVINAYSSVDISNSTFINNESYASGGAINAGTETGDTVPVINITNSTITENSSEYSGGAIKLAGATLYLTDCKLDINHGRDNGGAIAAQDAFYYDEYWGTETHTGNGIYVENTDFVSNSCDMLGGAIYINNYLGRSSSKLVIDMESSFISNSATFSGGAINANGLDRFEVYSTVFEDNVSTENGGAIYLNWLNSTPSIVGCTFTNNRAANQGGAIYTFDSLTFDYGNEITEDTECNDIYLATDDATIYITAYDLDMNGYFNGRITPNKYTLGRLVVADMEQMLRHSDLWMDHFSLTPNGNYYLESPWNMSQCSTGGDTDLVISTKYNITFNENGAANVKDMPETGKKGWNTSYGIPSNIPTASNGTFLGWDTNNKATTPKWPVTNNYNYIEYSVNADTTLYAIWDYVDGAYVDGINGSDSNDGKSPDKAVKTFRQAYENIKNEGGTIFIVDTVTVDKNMTLNSTSYTDENGTINLANGKSTAIIRYARPTAWQNLTDFTHEDNENIMISVVDSNELTLNNIVVDGHSIAIESSNSKEASEAVFGLGIIDNYGIININNTVIQNNGDLGIKTNEGAISNVNDSILKYVSHALVGTGGNINISNTEIHNNMFSALCIEDTISNINITNCKIFGNEFAILNIGGTINIELSEIYGNGPSENMYNYEQGIITIKDTYIHNNNSATEYGMYNEGELKLEGVTYSNNNTLHNSGKLNIKDSQLSGNSDNGAFGDVFGGAIYNTSTGVATIASSTFDSNTGVVGGAIYNTGTIELGSSTFVSNYANQAYSVSGTARPSVIHNEGTLLMESQSTFTFDRIIPMQTCVYNKDTGNATINIDVTAHYFGDDMGFEAGDIPVFNEGTATVEIDYHEINDDVWGTVGAQTVVVNWAGDLTVNKLNAVGNGEMNGTQILRNCDSGKTTINDFNIANRLLAVGSLISNDHDGLLIINDGNFSNCTNSAGDGIIINRDSVLEINSGNFENNTSTWADGGVIYSYNGVVNINGGTFTGNCTDSNGGVIYNNTGNIVITGGTFDNNSSLGYGDVIYNKNNSVVNILSGIFTRGDTWGALYNEGELNISGGLFSENNPGANTPIHNDINGILNITGGEFTDNGNTDCSWGSVVSNYGTASIQNAKFNNNGGSYGTIYNQSQMFIDNCTFDGNTSYNGGAIYNTAKEVKPSGLYNEDGTLYMSWEQLTSEGWISVSNGSASSGSAMSSIFEDKTLVIDESVTAIADNGFQDGSFKNVYIPDSVTSIGEYAFNSCANLESIRLSEKITHINVGMFQGCSKLKEIVIPDSVKTIQYYAFQDCTSLEKLVIPDTVTYIGDNIIYNCYNLKYLVIPSSIQYIEYQSFHCSGLEVVIIENGITSIGGSAFAGCYNLKYIEIPDTVTEIAPYAFEDCTSLNTIKLPSCIDGIYSSVFGNCTNLSNIIYKGTEIEWQSNGIDLSTTNNAFVVCSDTPSGLYSTSGELLYQWHEMIQYGIMDMATYDGKFGFKFYENDWVNYEFNLVIDSSIEVIPSDAFNYSNTSKTLIKSVYIPDSVTTIGERAFSRCSNLTSIVIPDSLTTISDFEFSGCSNLTSIVIPDSVTTIGRDTFCDCTSLTSILIPESVTTIGDFAFECASLDNIYYTGTEEQWNQISLGSDWDLGISEYEIVFLKDKQEPLTLKDFNIESSSAGGLTIQNSTFTNNSAPSGGGAIYNKGDINIIGCTFDKNISESGGGAIYDFSNSTIQNSKFSNNSANIGGAYFQFGNKSRITNCEFYNNSAKSNGGALRVIYEMDIYDSIFKDNTSEGNGGAILNQLGYLNLYNCELTNNTALGNGGAIDSEYYTSIVDTKIDNNKASLGSGIYVGSARGEGYGYPVSISGSTLIDPETNDVYLPNNTDYIKVTGELTEDKVARITPSDYTLGRTVVRVDTSATDNPYSVASEIYDKFTLEPYYDYALRPADYIDDSYGLNDTDVIISEAYKVEYNLNTYENTTSSTPDTQNKYWGEPLYLSEEIPTVPGYIFRGWDERTYVDLAIESPMYQPGDFYEENHNIKLFAQWELNITAAYISDAGDDGWSGATPSNPVKTFKQAYTNLRNTGGTIYVVGNVTLDRNTTLESTYYSDSSNTIQLADGAMVNIKRYSKPEEAASLTGFNVDSHTGTLITVPSGITLNIEGIMIDGHSVEVESGSPEVVAPAVVANSSMIKVNNGGLMNMYGTLLYNNTNEDGFGGAINNEGTAMLDWPAIDNNYAYSGGGIFNTGTMTIPYIEIAGNEAINGGAIFNRGTLDIQGGLAVANEAQNGGAISTDIDSITNIYEFRIYLNNATEVGGGIHNNNGTITSELLSVLNNSASKAGGGIYNTGSLSILDGSFIENESEDGSALYNTGTSIITDSTFENNISNIRGSVTNIGTVTLNNVTSYGNKGFHGNALFNSGNATINGGTYTSHDTTGSGGAIYTDGTLTISNNALFENNTSAGGGGAMISYGNTTIESGTFRLNSAVSGGAIEISKGTLTILDCTITENTATYGGAIFNDATFNSYGGHIDNNTAEKGAGIYNATKGIVNFDDMGLYNIDPILENNSWETIQQVIKEGKVAEAGWSVGDTKTLEINGQTKNATLIGVNHDGENTATFMVMESIGNRVMNSQRTNLGGWEASEMREWLNNDIYNSMTDVKDYIKTVDKLTDNVGYYSYSENNEPREATVTSDKVFLLSPVEAGVGWQIWSDYPYLDAFNGEGTIYDWFETNSLEGSMYWLRSPVSFLMKGLFFNCDGTLFDYYANYTSGVLPAFVIG